MRSIVLVLFSVALWCQDTQAAKSACFSKLWSLLTGRAAPKTEASLPFPDLAADMGERLGLARPTRAPLKPLFPHPDPEILSRQVLSQVLEKMSTYANWATVAYGSSSGTTEGRVYAEWYKRYARADVQEYFNQLSSTQRKIAIAAFRGGMADVRPTMFADEITLEWVHQNFPELDIAKYSTLYF